MPRPSKRTRAAVAAGEAHRHGHVPAHVRRLAKLLGDYQSKVMQDGSPGPERLALVLEEFARFELGELDGLRARGFSWAQMAPVYGVASAQAVQQRHRRLTERLSPPSS